MRYSVAMKLLVIFGAILVTVGGQLKHPRVCTDDGCLLGTSMTDTKNLRFDAFVGIPFAKPPVGKLRFKVAAFGKSVKRAPLLIAISNRNPSQSNLGPKITMQPKANLPACRNHSCCPDNRSLAMKIVST